MSAWSEIPARRVDRAAIKVSETLLVIMLLVAWIMATPALVAFSGAVMLVGAAFSKVALFRQFYFHYLKPVGLMDPDVVVDNPEPYRFAEALYGVFVLLGTMCLALGSELVGWTLVWLVVAAMGAHLMHGHCAGCTIYYYFNRMGVRGFRFSPVQSTVRTSVRSSIRKD